MQIHTPEGYATDLGTKDPITKRPLYDVRGGQDGNWASHIINPHMNFLSSIVFIFLIAILAALLKLNSKDPKSVAEKVCPGSTVSKKDYEGIVNGFLCEI